MAIISIKVFIDGTTGIDLSTFEGFSAKTNKSLKGNEKEIINHLKQLEIFLKGYESYETDALNK